MYVVTVFGDHGHVGRRKIDDDDDEDHDHNDHHSDEKDDESHSRSQRNKSASNNFIHGQYEILHSGDNFLPKGGWTPSPLRKEIISTALCGYPLVKVPVEKFLPSLPFS